MRTEQLLYVIEVANCGSISAAAEKLYMLQPNLSYAICKLEQELSQKIFVRMRNGVALTTFGKEFLVYATSVYEEYLIFQKMAIAEKHIGRLSVCSQYLKIASIAFSKLCMQNSEYSKYLELREERFLDVLDLVSSHQCEIGVIVIATSQRNNIIRLTSSMNLDYHQLSIETPCFIIGQSHPLYHVPDEHITINQMLQYPMISYERESKHLRSLICYRMIQQNNQRIVVSDRATLFEIVEQTNAFFISPYDNNRALRGNYRTIFRAIPIPNEDTLFEFGWIHSKQQSLSEIATQYIKLLENFVSK